MTRLMHHAQRAVLAGEDGLAGYGQRLPDRIGQGGQRHHQSEIRRRALSIHNDEERYPEQSAADDLEAVHAGNELVVSAIPHGLPLGLADRGIVARFLGGSNRHNSEQGAGKRESYHKLIRVDWCRVACWNLKFRLNDATHCDTYNRQPSRLSYSTYSQRRFVGLIFYFHERATRAHERCGHQRFARAA